MITFKRWILYFYFMLFVHFPKFSRSASSLGFEGAVEIGKIVESALITYLRNILRCVHQKPCSKAQTDVCDIFREGPVGPDAEETAERNRAHSHHVSQFRKIQRL